MKSPIAAYVMHTPTSGAHSKLAAASTWKNDAQAETQAILVAIFPWRNTCPTWHRRNGVSVDPPTIHLPSSFGNRYRPLSQLVNEILISRISEGDWDNVQPPSRSV